MASDAAIALAKELGVDFDSVKGTGVFGNKLLKDVQAAADAAAPLEITVGLATISNSQTPPPNSDEWIRSDWSDVRVFAVARNVLAVKFDVIPAQINCTLIKRDGAITWVTGHVAATA